MGDLPSLTLARPHHRRQAGTPRLGVHAALHHDRRETRTPSRARWDHGHHVLTGQVPLLELSELRRAGLDEPSGHRRGRCVRAFWDTPPAEGGCRIGFGAAQFCRPPRQLLCPRASHVSVVSDSSGTSRIKLLIEQLSRVRVPLDQPPGLRPQRTTSAQAGSSARPPSRVVN